MPTSYGDYRPNCKKCGKTMVTVTDINKARCYLQFGINETLFCVDCDVKEDRKERIREILSNPSSPYCGDCKRRGSDDCLHERFGDLEYGSDSCFTAGERQLSVRFDCTIEGDAHLCHA